MYSHVLQNTEIPVLMPRSCMPAYIHTYTHTNRLRMGRRIVIVPSTDHEGIASSFTVSCFSDAAVSLRKLPDERRSGVSGDWTSETSGGWWSVCVCIKPSHACMHTESIHVDLPSLREDSTPETSEGLVVYVRHQYTNHTCHT
jgi:hypothetical protein